MATFRDGKVVEILERFEGLQRVRIALADQEIEASVFTAMVGEVAPGDRVVVNTTAIELGLGTGGEGFVLWNLDGDQAAHGSSTEDEAALRNAGHIVKLRYTPWQTEVLAAEEPASPHHGALAETVSIARLPVVACGLHSQVAGVVAGMKAAAPDARVGYLMTDGAALPIVWSRLVRALKEARLLDVTCTSGHAFGGDLEAVNVFSGLAALWHAANVDLAAVGMGPGIVGTGTALGFTGIEQGQVLDAITALNGRAIACLRVSFDDARDRHRPVSHHTLTALTIAARERATVVVPRLPNERAEEVRTRLADAGIDERHDLVDADGGLGLELLEQRGIDVTSMGRDLHQVPELFLAAAAAGAYAASLL